MEEKPNRRWLHFSVRTLLVAVTIFCVWLGWLAWQFSIIQDRKALAATLIAGGTDVTHYPVLMPEKAHLFPQWRRWLGDDSVATVAVNVETISREDYERIPQVFPEADIWPHDEFVDRYIRHRELTP